jgi:hypothetical protein
VQIDILGRPGLYLSFIEAHTRMYIDRRFKVGSCSILLGNRWITKPFAPKKGKLLRVSKLMHRHNDAPYLDTIRTIPEYSKYYAIPDVDSVTMTEKDEWWRDFKEKWGKMEHVKTLFAPGTVLVCQYIPDAGHRDIIDALDTFTLTGDRSVWNSYASVWRMAQQVGAALKFLHEKKLCHLDIKAENVMVSNSGRRYKIIDFGFCSKEPFADFVNDPRGTPGYFPKQLDNTTEPGLPLIYANDMVPVDGKIPMRQDPKYVYAIDAFSFGRLINYVFYTYDNRSIASCFGWERGGYKGKLQTLLVRVLEEDVRSRITICEAHTLGLFS